MPGPRYNDAGVSQSARSVVLVKNERNHSTKSPRHRRRRRHRCAVPVHSLIGQIFIFSGNKEVSLSFETFETLRSPSFPPHRFNVTNHRFSPSRAASLCFPKEPLPLLLAVVYPLWKSQANFRQVESVPNRLHT